jgi:hypothetical protein
MSAAAPDLIAQAEALLAELDAREVTARALGGIGVALSCPAAHAAPLRRAYEDIDVVVGRRDARRLDDAMRASGYRADERFNAMHGRTRMLYLDAADRHVDVFVGAFKLCHELDLEARLRLPGPALAPADLLLTKLQIAELNLKDVTDVLAVLHDHPLGSEAGSIELDYVSGLLARDWGWWRTVTENLGRVRDVLARSPEYKAVAAPARERLDGLEQAIARRPKSMRWKARARVGDRVAWREQPEEVAR